MSVSIPEKPVSEWVSLLSSGGVSERCAAALALAEFGPDASPAKEALLTALNDDESPVRIAAQVAIGFIHVPAEYRWSMFDHLLGTDYDSQRAALDALEGLGNSPLLGTAGAPEEERIAPIASSSTSPQPQSSPASYPAVEEPDIALVHLLPWWFLLGGVFLVLICAWLLRGVPRTKLVMAGAFFLCLLWLAYNWTRKESRSISLKQFHARVRLAFAIVFASAVGFLIGLCFPSGSIHIDNESGREVCLLLDGEEWLTVKSGESRRKALSYGSYQVTIKTIEGGDVLDEHPIQISASGPYVLNVLGGQIYFEGIVQYGNDGGSMKATNAKWFEVPKVDYLYRSPPESIVSAHPVNKTYFTKGAPPKFGRR